MRFNGAADGKHIKLSILLAALPFTDANPSQDTHDTVSATEAEVVRDATPAETALATTDTASTPIPEPEIVRNPAFLEKYKGLLAVVNAAASHRMDTTDIPSGKIDSATFFRTLSETHHTTPEIDNLLNEGKYAEASAMLNQDISTIYTQVMQTLGAEGLTVPSYAELNRQLAAERTHSTYSYLYDTIIRQGTMMLLNEIPSERALEELLRYLCRVKAPTEITDILEPIYLKVVLSRVMRNQSGLISGAEETRNENEN